MASLTYGKSTRWCRYRLEQIAFLIIAFLACTASGIRNSSPKRYGNNKGAVFDDDASYEFEERETHAPILHRPHYGHRRPTSIGLDSEEESSSEMVSANFRPSQQILDFTASDATPTMQHHEGSYSKNDKNNRFAPTGATTPINILPAPPKQQHIANKRFSNENTQLTFPSASSFIDDQYGGNFDSAYKRITTSGVSTVRPHIPTTPIFSYHDPFTYQNYQASSSSPSTSSSSSGASSPKLQFEDDDVIYYDQQGSSNQREDAPQSYTVQSTLLVGNNNNNNFNNPNRGDDNSVSHESGTSFNGYRPLSSPNNDYKRPGYVFDEQIRPNHISNTNKFKQHQQQQQTQQQKQHFNALPETIQDDGKQRPIPQRLSYDSHDYPPPSYYQRPTHQQQQQHHHQQQKQKQQKEKLQLQHQQQSTYFQTPQRQDIGFNSISQPLEQFDSDYLSAASIPSASTISPPSKFSNYANNFGNYLLNDADQQNSQYYPHSRPHPHSHPHQYQQSQPQPQSQSQPQPQPHSHPHSHSHQKQQQQQQQYPVNYKPSYPPGNYVHNPQPQYHQQPQQSQRPSGYRPTASKPSNYYDYQLGEIPPARPTPPPPYNNPNYYGVQRPTGTGTGTGTATPPSGLASLASLFTSTQQYAPQFTNLLLGALSNGGGGGNVGGGSATSSTYNNRPTKNQQQQQHRPINMQLIKALENIARNDDLQCVPKVLCQTIAGQTQRGQLPSFITSPAITNFLAGFPAASPALIYGRAALLGLSGGERSCAQTYAQCPKSEYEIIHYLNNHRGGFFKFFSEPEEQPGTSSSTTGNGNYDGSSNGGNDGNGISSSLLSILSALAGTPVITPTRRPTTTTTTTLRPATTVDIAGGIGNFFNQVLTDYLSGVEYQRRRRRRRRSVEDFIGPETARREGAASARQILNDEDFHDEEDSEDIDDVGENARIEDDETQEYDDVEPRILHKDEQHANGNYPKFFPDEQLETFSLDELMTKFNAEKTSKKLRFPTGNVDNRNPSGSWVSFIDTADDENRNYERPTVTRSTRRGKKMNFKIHDDYEALTSPSHHSNHVDEMTSQHVIFPDHYEQHIRKGRILNRPNYASSYGDYVRTSADEDDDRFVVSNAHRRPHYQNFDTGNSNTLTTSSNFHDQSNSQSNRYSSSQETGFRPTRTPTLSSYAGSSSSSSSSNSQNYNNYNKYNNNSKYNYPNNNYVSNNRYSSNYQRPTINPTTRRPRHEDDQNIYVTNGQGVTEYYITPNGRKVYLRG